MKKALQIPHLRARGSVSDGAVGRGPDERRFYDFRDRFAQLWIIDRGGQLRGLARLLRRRLEPRRREGLRRRLGQWPRGEAEPRTTRQPTRDLGRPLRQLEAPDRVADMHDERSVGLRPRRPRVSRDLLAHGLGPSGDDVAGPAVRPHAAQLGPDLLAEGLHYAAASSTVPGVTSSSWSGAAGSIAASVAVTSACPALRTRAARIRRRPGSSS